MERRVGRICLNGSFECTTETATVPSREGGDTKWGAQITYWRRSHATFHIIPRNPRPSSLQVSLRERVGGVDEHTWFRCSAMFPFYDKAGGRTPSLGLVDPRTTWASQCHSATMITQASDVIINFSLCTHLPPSQNYAAKAPANVFPRPSIVHSIVVEVLEQKPFSQHRRSRKANGGFATKSSQLLLVANLPKLNPEAPAQNCPPKCSKKAKYHRLLPIAPSPARSPLPVEYPYT